MLKQLEMEKDIITLVLRLIGEDPDTFSPETLRVMKKYQRRAYDILAGREDNTSGELVTLKEVRPVYGQGYNWLFLGFDMPKTKYNVGDKVRLVKEG